MREVVQRRLTFDLSHVLSPNRPGAEQIGPLSALALALYAIDLAWLDATPNAPSILDGNVRYAVDPRGVEIWRDLGALHARGKGDCKAIACGYAAELTRAGQRALPAIVPAGDQEGLDWHVVVQLEDGTFVDPCVWLGMQ